MAMIDLDFSHIPGEPKLPIEQRSPEWYQQRLGKVTASRIADMMRTTKSGYSTKRDNYAAQLVCERLTGVVAESYISKEMQWGLDNEEKAIAAYEFRYACLTEKIGFVNHPTIELAGASPDRLVGDDGLVEIKCPLTATHINTSVSGKIDPDYITQMQFQMACTGRKWCDFVSFDPRLPQNMQLFTKRIVRDNMVIDRLEKEVRLFLSEVGETIKRLQKVYG